MLPLMMREFMLLLLLLLSVSQAAPKDGATRSKPEALQQPLPNPFVPGQEQLRLLQSYLKGLERMEEEPGHMSREQVLLYLFALHDYDQSGQLDGLELLSMLTAALAPGATDSSPTNPVILVVDKVLETQDLNGDGLMTPAELINFPGETPKEPVAPKHQEPHDIGRQPLLPRSPLGQEAPEALSLREAGEQIEARRVSMEAVQEAGGLAKAEVEALGPREDAGGPAEVGEAPGPKGEAGEQAEARDTAEAAEELPGERLESQNTPQEFEGHSIQLENDEI